MKKLKLFNKAKAEYPMTPKECDPCCGCECESERPSFGYVNSYAEALQRGDIDNLSIKRIIE